ncbi:MAG: hypothetical protein D6702_09675 [Planctomycetota bacterium]|nr:MAG: hypothetical protein D6702_09675 [Planctomycetota bacterium]
MSSSTLPPNGAQFKPSTSRLNSATESRPRPRMWYGQQVISTAPVGVSGVMMPCENWIRWATNGFIGSATRENRTRSRPRRTPGSKTNWPAYSDLLSPFSSRLLKRRAK